jgi:acid phosphatase
VSLRAVVAVGCAALALTALTGCSPDGTTGSVTTPATSSSPATDDAGAAAAGDLPAPDHVMVVIFENEDAQNIVGGPEAPYLTSLAESGATFSDAHGETHPSQPNYLALFSGSTQGVVDDSCPLTFTGPNLAAQLRGAGRSFVGYSEDLPKAGYTGCRTAGYARKHNPWVNFTGLPGAMNQPYSALPEDFANLPTVSFVVPNLCDDMHDCGVAAGDSWARDHLARYASWAQQHNSLLVVTFDEDNGSPDNHIATLLVGSMVEPGASGQRIDHYSLLRTLEDMYGLSPLGSAAGAAPLTGVWR